MNEIGRCANSGKILVKVNPKFFRPAEVNRLQGDASKAKRILGWEPCVSFEELAREMVLSDLEYHSVSQEKINEFCSLNTGKNSSISKPVVSKNIVESILEILISTRKVRLGPAPSKKVCTRLREILTQCTSKGLPVPILTVFSPAKLPPGNFYKKRKMNLTFSKKR